MSASRKRNIVLCGFMASGKSSVGREISVRTGMPFIDTDPLIESREGRNISSIFLACGEPYFRKLEKDVIREVSGCEGTVLAVGGGAVLDEENVELLKKNGRIYLLEVSFDVVKKRTKSDGTRPLLEGKNPDEIRALLEERIPRYLKAADAVVDTSGRTIEEIADEVIRDFEGYADVI